MLPYPWDARPELLQREGYTSIWGLRPPCCCSGHIVALTGHYLFQSEAVVIFCVIGFLASVGLLCALWRRYFAEVSVGVVAGRRARARLGDGAPVILARCQIYEVSISCGYALTMLALAAIWRRCMSRRGGAGGWRRRVWLTGWRWGRGLLCCSVRSSCWCRWSKRGVSDGGLASADGGDYSDHTHRARTDAVQFVAI